ncbi:MAG: hypothetical protein K2P99_05750 [Burkholderiales bacterium]|nr:hypothetical protein [Burkholderiales bacterium]
MLGSCSGLVQQQNNNNQQKKQLLHASKDYTQNPQVIAIIKNKLSMTTSLKKLNNNFSVHELYSGTQRNIYIRFVTLKLESTPVIVAVSSTYHNNHIFYDILTHSNNSPIGSKLFALNSGITRNPNMLISIVCVSKIDSKTLQQYLSELGYKPNQKIIQRTSIFLYKNTESMQLTEYILPAIVDFIK